MLFVWVRVADLSPGVLQSVAGHGRAARPPMRALVYCSVLQCVVVLPSVLQGASADYSLVLTILVLGKESLSYTHKNTLLSDCSVALSLTLSDSHALAWQRAHGSHTLSRMLSLSRVRVYRQYTQQIRSQSLSCTRWVRRNAGV